MLHRYEDVVINPIVMDSDFPLAKLMLLRQYGFVSEELIRDPLNFYLKFGNDIPLNVDSVTLTNLVSVMDNFTSSALASRWAATYDMVPNKIPLSNFANTYYELWALIINRNRHALTQYINKLRHILLCEGVPYPNIFIQNVTGATNADVLMNSNYIVLRIYVTTGE